MTFRQSYNDKVLHITILKIKSVMLINKKSAKEKGSTSDKTFDLKKLTETIKININICMLANFKVLELHNSW